MLPVSVCGKNKSQAKIESLTAQVDSLSQVVAYQKLLHQIDQINNELRLLDHEICFSITDLQISATNNLYSKDKFDSIEKLHNKYKEQLFKLKELADQARQSYKNSSKPQNLIWINAGYLDSKFEAVEEEYLLNLSLLGQLKTMLDLYSKKI